MPKLLCYAELRWWSSVLLREDSLFIKSLASATPSCHLFTDACLTQWGGVLGEIEVSGKFKPKHHNLSINTKELLAVWYSVCSLKDLLVNATVLIHTDNTMTLYCLWQLGSRDMYCNNITKRIFYFLKDLGSQFITTFVQGSLNSKADTAS